MIQPRTNLTICNDGCECDHTARVATLRTWRTL